MAVGYHKINTSAARSKRRREPAGNSAPVQFHCAGLVFSDPTYGECVLMDDFVSDCDNVRVSTAKGEIVVRGGWVRANISG